MSGEDPDGVGPADGPDLEPPSDVALPSVEEIMDEVGSVEPEEVDESRLSTTVDSGYEFCVLYSGRPWIPVHLQANSAGEAVAWIRVIVDHYNLAVQQAGYQPLCSWAYGPCSP